MLLLIAAAATGLFVGGTFLDPGAVANVLFHGGRNETATIVWDLRLPRIAIGATVGAALAMAGALLQGLLRNPLADPYLTGVSAGSALAIVLCVVAGVASAAIPGIGFIAGILTAMLVVSLSRRGAGIDVPRLVLAGVSLSALFAAIITLVLVQAQGANASAAIVSWLAGTLSGRGWDDLRFAIPYVAAGIVLAFLSAPMLNALRVGELRARAAGIDLNRAQWAILSGATLLSAVAVTLSGTIGFVGLIVPHAARRIVGSDARRSIPAAALLGATLTILADAVARSVIAPEEIPLGVLLAFIGVPAFLYLSAHSRTTVAQ